MPTINRKLCPKHGIFEGSSRCPQCKQFNKYKKKENQKDYDKNHRDKERKKFYNSAVWKKLRNNVLMKEPLCRECERAAQTVDHICPISQGGERLRVENLQSLCFSCHSRKTISEKQIFYPEWLQLPKIPVTLVCGGIGSGKSHYVRQHASDDDLVIDLDDIKMKLTNKDMYRWDDGEKLKESIKERNRILFNLSYQEATKYKKAWFIASAPKGNVRMWWAEKLNADVILINTSHKDCIDRVTNDVRRLHAVDKHIALVHKWFEKHTPSPIDCITDW